MTQVRASGDYEQWIRFFLQAIGDSAQDAVRAIDALTALHKKNAGKISAVQGRSKSTLIKLFDYLESNPIIGIRQTADDLGVSFNTVAKAVERLTELNILVQSKKTGRTRTFAYEAYIAILRQNT